MTYFQKTVSNGLLALCLVIILGNAAFAQWVNNPTNNHWYRLTEEMYYGVHDESANDLSPDWFDAEVEAQSYNPEAHLVTINDQAENDWLVATFGSETSFWIGFTDHSAYSSEGVWVWVSGEPVSFVNWDVIQPDNYLQGEDSAHLIHLGSPHWNDLGNDNTHGAGIDSPYYGIVELPGQLVPNEMNSLDGVKAVFR